MNLIDDCERFILRSFDGIKQSAMHIYHSALSWTPTSSPIRQLYDCELMTETNLINAVGPTWDACIRIIPVGVGVHVEGVVFSPSGALIAARERCCIKVFDAMTGVNRATFDEDKSISSVAFSPDDGFLVSWLWGGTMNVWEVQTGTIFQTFQANMWNLAYSIAFSSCGTIIATGNSDWTVRIWNISTGGCDCVFQGHSGAVTDVCWLATCQKQVVSAAQDCTVRIWDVQKQTCSKIFAQYRDPVAALAFSQGLLLVTSTNGTMNIYDSQSGDIIYIIRSNNITHSRFSIDGGKVLVARENSGSIWEIATKRLTRVGNINYNGGKAMFSPDGTRIASIYGKFLKIWKTNPGYNHHEASSHVYNNVYISPDEQLVAMRSTKEINVLDVTTGRSLFRKPVINFLSIGLSRDLGFVSFLKRHSTDCTVQTWNVHTCHHKSIIVGHDVFSIALSPDGTQLASLSPHHIELWDWKSTRHLAKLEFNMPFEVQAQISFATTTSVSVLQNSNGAHNWCISPNYSTKTRLPMIFVPTTEERSNQNASTPCQSYHYKMDSEWILDQDGRRVLWMPPDERPREIWCFKCKKKVLIQTEGGKVYFVDFFQS